jgi:chaperone modulatory protein CbpM
MNDQELISIELLSDNLHIETSFIASLEEYGLVTITTINQVSYITSEQVADIERLARLRYEMDVNLEGIEAISHILQRIQLLQSEVTSLKNKLRFYEEIV